MSEWWTYRPEDFLLFSPRVYWRMFELHNAALWPLQVLALAAGLIIILLVAWRPRSSARWLALLLAILWIFVGWSFLWNRYAAINWAAAYVAPAFAVEGVLLLVSGPLLDGLAFDRRGLAGCIGYFLLAFALAGQPLLAPLQGRGWASSEVFGIAPDPTAIATLGLLLLARGRLLPLLLPIPVLWCLLSGITLRTMGEPQAWVPHAALLLAAAACIWTIIRQRVSQRMVGLPKRALDEICQENKVDVMLHAFVGSAERDHDRIVSVTYHDHGGAHRLHAKAFVDATGDCDLASFAGASTRYGNHGAVNLGTLGTRFGGISSDAEVSADAISRAVQAARTRGVGPMTKERSVVARLPGSGDVVCYLASADYDPRDGASLTRAEMSGREQAWAYLDVIRTIPGCERAYLASTGPKFGTRESRHINSVKQLTWNDVESDVRHDDTVALGAWGVEWHDRRTFESTMQLPPDGGAFDIPLRCLMSADTPNLFAAGRTADGDRQAGASIRVMGTAFATGQAAGVAAAGLAQSDAVDPTAVRNTLLTQNALIDRHAMPAPIDIP